MTRTLPSGRMLNLTSSESVGAVVRGSSQSSRTQFADRNSQPGHLVCCLLLHLIQSNVCSVNILYITKKYLNEPNTKLNLKSERPKLNNTFAEGYLLSLKLKLPLCHLTSERVIVSDFRTSSVIHL